MKWQVNFDKMAEFKIYKPDNTLLLDIPVSDSSFATDEIMNVDTLSLEFEMIQFIEIPLDSYCVFRGKTYYLLADCDFTKNSERDHSYKLTMHSDVAKAKDVKFGFAPVIREAGHPIRFDYAKKTETSFTGKPIDFAQLWVDNMNIAEGTNEWQVGDCTDLAMQTLDFNDQSCFDMLGQFYEKFKTEWSFTGKTLHLKPFELNKDNPLPLSYGYDNGIVSGINRTNYSSAKVINRILMKGSDRNIVFKTYRDTKLHLPKNFSIKYDGNYFSDEPEFVDSVNAIEYVTDANGAHVERADRIGRVREDSLDCTTIYPMHEGTITSVDANNNLVFYDTNNTINYKDSLIEGNTMMLIPQSGDLIGREFEVNYNHANKRFTLKRIDSNNDLTYPSDLLKPRVGDIYAVFKIALPQQYIDEAELKALKMCVKYLYENEVPQYTYKITLSELYSKENWAEIGDRLNIGNYVSFSDSKFLPEGAIVRIVKTEYYVNKPYQPKIELSNRVTGRSYSNRQNSFINQEQTIDRNKQEQTERLNSSEYVRRALTNRTEIDKGLVLTSLIELGLFDEDTELFENTAGINGIYQNPDDVAYWAGGTLEQAVNLVTNPSATSNVANYVVTHGGRIIANNAYIKGRIEATSGRIGGFNIEGSSLVNTGFDNDASIIFRNDTYKTFAAMGGNVLPSSSGVKAVARFENNDPNNHWGLGRNIAMIVEASGADENTAIYMAGGNIAGLAMRVRRIDSDTTATFEDVYFSCYNANAITLKIPKNVTDGKVYYIRLNNPASVTIDAFSLGENRIMAQDGSLVNTIIANTRGEEITLFWDGQYWLYSTTAT